MLSTLPTPWTDSPLSLVSPKCAQIVWERAGSHLCERRSQTCGRRGLSQSCPRRIPSRAVRDGTHVSYMWMFPRHARRREPLKCMGTMSDDSVRTSACLTLSDALKRGASDSLRSNTVQGQVFIFKFPAESEDFILCWASQWEEIHRERFQSRCARWQIWHLGWRKQEPSSDNK